MSDSVTRWNEMQEELADKRQRVVSQNRNDGTHYGESDSNSLPLSELVRKINLARGIAHGIVDVMPLRQLEKFINQ